MNFIASDAVWSRVCWIVEENISDSANRYVMGEEVGRGVIRSIEPAFAVREAEKGDVRGSS